MKGSEGCIIGPCNKLSDDATLTHTAEDAVQTKDALLRTAVLYAAAEATHGTCCQYSHLTSGGEEWKERHSVYLVMTVVELSKWRLEAGAIIA